MPHVDGKQHMTPVRKKMNRTHVSKKKKHQHKVLCLFNAPIRSPVNSQFMTKTSTNSSDDHIPGIVTIDTSAWIQYSDPWNPTRLTMAREATDRNGWYSFLYDVFLDGWMSCWGG
jgi:hypothetical protein